MVYKFGKHEIEIYDSIQTLPILRFQKFNKYQMIAAEIGSDFADFDARTAKVLAFLQKGMINDAIGEMSNFRMTVFNAFNEQSPRNNCFATLIRRIDSVRYDRDDENAPEDFERILQHLEQIKFEVGKSVEKLTEVKKNSSCSLVSIIRKSFLKVATRKK